MPTGIALFAAWVLVLQAVLGAYDGWYSALYFGDEIVNPGVELQGRGGTIAGGEPLGNLHFHCASDSSYLDPAFLHKATSARPAHSRVDRCTLGAQCVSVRPRSKTRRAQSHGRLPGHGC
jgi:hypothetical protein